MGRGTDLRLHFEGQRKLPEVRGRRCEERAGEARERNSNGA